MLAGVIDEWNRVRKKARVLLVIDVSGSMGDEADPDTGDTKLDLAKRAAIAALGEFNPEDEVGLRIFSTDISNREPTDYRRRRRRSGRCRRTGRRSRASIERLVPTQGTPLYTVTGDSYEKMVERVRPDAHQRRRAPQRRSQRGRRATRTSAGCCGLLRAQNEGEATRPVRIFPIAYGGDADEATLKRIAEATNAASYSAVDPATIVNVFNAVVSNF